MCRLYSSGADRDLSGRLSCLDGFRCDRVSQTNAAATLEVSAQKIATAFSTITPRVVPEYASLRPGYARSSLEAPRSPDGAGRSRYSRVLPAHSGISASGSSERPSRCVHALVDSKETLT